MVSPAAGTISHPGQQPVTSFLSLWSQDSGFTDQFGKSKQSSARTLPGEAPLLLPATVPCALRTALPELPAGFSLPSSTRGCLCPSAPVTGPWLPFRASASRGFAAEQDGFVRTSAPPACSSSRLRRQHRGFMITSLFDWFHQPVIISLPKLFRQRRQHRTVGICKDKRPERHLPEPTAGPAGPQPRSLLATAGTRPSATTPSPHSSARGFVCPCPRSPGIASAHWDAPSKEDAPSSATVSSRRPRAR